MVNFWKTIWRYCRVRSFDTQDYLSAGCTIFLFVLYLGNTIQCLIATSLGLFLWIISRLERKVLKMGIYNERKTKDTNKGTSAEKQQKSK